MHPVLQEIGIMSQWYWRNRPHSFAILLLRAQFRRLYTILQNGWWWPTFDSLSSNSGGSLPNKIYVQTPHWNAIYTKRGKYEWIYINLIENSHLESNIRYIAWLYKKINPWWHQKKWNGILLLSTKQCLILPFWSIHNLLSHPILSNYTPTTHLIITVNIISYLPI